MWFRMSLLPSGSLQQFNLPQLAPSACFPLKQAGEEEAALLCSDNQRSYLTSSILQWFSLYLHERSFPLLGLEDATEIQTRGLPRYAEVRLRGVQVWVLLNPRARYICTRDKLTQLLAALICFFSVFITSMARSWNSSNWTLFCFVLYLPLENHLVACLQSGSVDYESLLFFLIWYIYMRDLVFIPKMFVYDVHSK